MDRSASIGKWSDERLMHPFPLKDATFLCVTAPMLHSNNKDLRKRKGYVLRGLVRILVGSHTGLQPNLQETQ